ncbi:integrase arm-type DNA-binding domain-containing protein, partial [Klebsiella pneumoniae]
LLVNPGGSRLWYLKYRINGKESRLGLGAYPDVSLSDARQQRDGIRKLLAQNINPAQQRIAERAARSSEKVFKTVALAGLSQGGYQALVSGMNHLESFGW